MSANVNANTSANAVRMRTMTHADIALGMRLKTQAGWNQTQADWQRFITLSPQGCFVASANGVDVGTAATFNFKNIGWIAMILVDPQARGQGVGSAMMNHCLSHLTANNVTTIRLDATDLGKPVYDKLGFVDQFKLVRYEGTLQANASLDTLPGVMVSPVQPADLSDMLAIDLTTTRTLRHNLLEQLVNEVQTSTHCSAFIARLSNKITGYCLTRRGANASFIGPCVATSDAAGLSLLNAAANELSGQRILIDIPVDHEAANRWATQQGLTLQRQLTRMSKGNAILEQVDHLWASSGPEKG